MPSVVRITPEGKVKDVVISETLTEQFALESIDTKMTLTQALIPLGLQAVADELAVEVTRLAGPKHSHTAGLPGYVRCGACQRL